MPSLKEFVVERKKANGPCGLYEIMDLRWCLVFADKGTRLRYFPL